MNAKVKDILEWVYCIIIALALAMLFRYFIGTPTIVQQVSMNPTLVEGQRLWLNRWGRTTKTLPKRGEIITFEEPEKLEYAIDEIDQANPVAKYKDRTGLDWFIHNFLEIGKRSYIKRVIAMPGEHVQIKEGKVFINGEELEESYLEPDVITESQILTDFIVPDGYLFCMGDNRTQSTDCREFGCIPFEKIEGIVICRFWPLNQIGSVE